MGQFVRGQVVVLPFPFSNLTTKQWRPSLVLANGNYNDLIVCMITAMPPSGVSVKITEKDFVEGKLDHPTSYVRPDRIFTAEATMVRRKVGTLTSSKVDEILIEVQRIFGVNPGP